MTIALCVDPHWKGSIRLLSQTYTTAPILKQSHYFRQNIWRLPAAQFHFWMIFGFELKFSLLQKLKSIAVQAVFRQDVNKMWGRVEHLPQKSASNILAMKKIRKIFVFFKFHFHNDGRPRPKNYFEMFFWAHINLLVCKISSWSDMPNRFFANQCHIFHKYLTGIFFPESFESFWPARSGIFKIGSKLSKY